MSCNTDLYKSYFSEVEPTWCGGCGNYGIWTALKLALTELNVDPSQVMLCFDVGCNGNMNDKILGYRFHGLHGRVIPVASGIKISNPNLIVIAMAGDGATYSEGMGHFVHALRNEYPITLLVHDNENYGLTTGQCSSLTRQDIPMNSNPDGNTGKTLNPLQLAMSLKTSFIAQSFSGEIKHMKGVIKEAIKHQIENRGLSYVNLLQSCPTYNKATTQNWYFEKTKMLNDKNSDTKFDPKVKVEDYIDHDCLDYEASYKLVGNIENNVPLGILYKNPNAISYLARLKHREEKWGSSTTVFEVEKTDVTELINSYA